MPEIKIVDVQIPFWSVMKLVVKFKIAAMLLLLVLLVIYLGLVVLFSIPFVSPNHNVLSGLFFS